MHCENQLAPQLPMNTPTAGETCIPGDTCIPRDTCIPGWRLVHWELRSQLIFTQPLTQRKFIHSFLLIPTGLRAIAPASLFPWKDWPGEPIYFFSATHHHEHSIPLNHTAIFGSKQTSDLVHLPWILFLLLLGVGVLFLRFRMLTAMWQRNALGGCSSWSQTMTAAVSLDHCHDW